MQYSGLTKQQIEHVAELEYMEKFFLDPDCLVKPRLIAKALTCLAHDYVEMGLEERGFVLLLKADDKYPGYHGQPMKEDMDVDPDFATLAISLSKELILMALSTARDNK